MESAVDGGGGGGGGGAVGYDRERLMREYRGDGNQMSSSDACSICDTSRLLTVKDVQPLTDVQLQELLLWVDEAPMTREKKNLARDLSDAVPVAEIIKHFIPKFIELHSYQPANSVRVKEQNWFLLSRKVLWKLGFELDPDFIHSLAQGRPWAIETLLMVLRDSINRYFYDNPTLTTNRTAAEDVSAFERDKAVTSLKQMAENQRRQIQKQQKTIDALTTKILKLQHLSHLKDIRVEDLLTRLGKAGLTGPNDRIMSKVAADNPPSIASSTTSRSVAAGGGGGGHYLFNETLSRSPPVKRHQRLPPVNAATTSR